MKTSVTPFFDLPGVKPRHTFEAINFKMETSKNQMT